MLDRVAVLARSGVLAGPSPATGARPLASLRSTSVLSWVFHVSMCCSGWRASLCIHRGRRAAQGEVREVDDMYTRKEYVETTKVKA